MKYRIIFLYTALLFLLSSCDGIRATLGMATSNDIAVAKYKLLSKATKEAEKQLKADSMAISNVIDSSMVKEQAGYQEVLNKKYYIITGSFKDKENTNSMLDFLKKQGYEPINIHLKNGYDMVSLCGYDTYASAMAEIRKLNNSDVCPYDIWIYDVSQGLHE